MTSSIAYYYSDDLGALLVSFLIRPPVLGAFSVASCRWLTPKSEH